MKAKIWDLLPNELKEKIAIDITKSSNSELDLPLQDNDKLKLLQKLEEIYLESKYGWIKNEVEKINNMLISAKNNYNIQFIKISFLTEAERKELSKKYLLARIRNYFTTIESPIISITLESLNAIPKGYALVEYHFTQDNKIIGNLVKLDEELIPFTNKITVYSKNEVALQIQFVERLKKLLK